MLNGSLDAGRAVRTVSAKNIWTALFNGARCVLRVWSMWQERSAGRDALVRLDHHMLRDIGLTRADVEREAILVRTCVQPERKAKFKRALIGIGESAPIRDT